MASVSQIATAGVQRRIRWVQIATIERMIVVAAASLFAAQRAQSPALFAFGRDSANELLSAAMVLWGFRAQATQAHTEKRLANSGEHLKISTFPKESKV
jgi:hypothetical protein